MSTTPPPACDADSDSTPQHVRAVVHVRPLLPSEAAAGATHALTARATPPTVDCAGSRFAYDAVYGGGDGAAPGRLYGDAVAPLVAAAFRGVHGAVLAYGATGSGKTHTMGAAAGLPGARREGVMPAALADVCVRAAAARAAGVSVSVRASFVEVLGDDVFDLLVPPRDRAHLPLRDGGGGGSVTVSGAASVDVASRDDVASLLAAAASARATGATALNASSSRSHAVMTVTIEQRLKNGGKATSSALGVAGADWPPTSAAGGGGLPPPRAPAVPLGATCLWARLHLVDLAGSERASRTGATGARLKEGAAINRGLLALGNVIAALAAREASPSTTRHIPYRDSKLTRLLADALGGCAATVLIACASPTDADAPETRATLRYAARARAITTAPTVNADPAAAELAALRAEVAALKAENAALRKALESGSGGGGNRTPTPARRMGAAASLTPPPPVVVAGVPPTGLVCTPSPVSGAAAAFALSPPPPPGAVTLVPPSQRPPSASPSPASGYLREAVAARARAAALRAEVAARAAARGSVGQQQQQQQRAPRADEGPLAAGLAAVGSPRRALAPRGNDGGGRSAGKPPAQVVWVAGRWQ